MEVSLETGVWRGRAGFVAVVIVLAVGFAGCIGESVPEGGDEGSDGDPPWEDASRGALEWSLMDCAVVVAVVPVEADAVAERLPEGFEPVSAEESLGLPPDPRGEGAIAFETFACAAGAGLDGEVQDLAYGAIFAPVAAPGDAPGPSADVHFYKWETLVPDEDRRQVLRGAGLPAVDGSSGLSGFEATPTGHVFDASLTLDGATFQFTGVAPAPNQDFRDGFTFLEHQQGDDGLAYWVSYENEAVEGNSGSGTLMLDPGHWASDVVGAQSTQAYMVASPEVHFTDGEIVLP